MSDAALRLKGLLEQVLGAPLPLRVRAWDGSQAGPPDAPTLVVRNRRAVRRLLWKPGELGLARAWVAGDLDIDGDLYATLDLLAGLIWERGDDARTLVQALRDPGVRAAVRGLVVLAGPPLPPAPPREEVRRPRRHLHSKRSDKRAISHHYDVGNDFYEIVLGPSMVYSCAYWSAPEPGTLEDAQRDKLELICRKLDLKPGQRLLDVGCGWGSMAIHAAREHGVSVVGITLSQEQAAYARKRVADKGLTDRIEIRVQDYREVHDGPYDALSSRRARPQPPDLPPPRARRILLPPRRVHRRLRLPRRRTRPPRHHRQPAGARRLRGARRGVDP
jgi:cyclopropane-fatty-acyl-phospholipid synthase